MYLGAVVTALNILFGNLPRPATPNGVQNAKPPRPAGRRTFARRAGARAGASHATDAARHANTMAGEIALVVGFGGLIGVVCWLVIAAAARRGRAWTRAAAILLLALYTAGPLVVLIGTDNDPGVQATTVIIWIIGLAATILLWGRQARDFFAYYRR